MPKKNAGNMDESGSMIHVSCNIIRPLLLTIRNVFSVSGRPYFEVGLPGPGYADSGTA